MYIKPQLKKKSPVLIANYLGADFFKNASYFS